MAPVTVFPTPFGALEIGADLPPVLVAEIGLNHNGSPELARELIRQAAQSGASIVKFQKRSPADLAVAAYLDAPFAKCPTLGRTQRQVRERLELSLDDYVALRRYAESLGLLFSASAFDVPSLEFLLQAGVGIVKVASHSVTNGPLLRAVAATGLPVVCSLGGATEAERDAAVAILRHAPLVLMHCVSSYPTPDTLIRLDTIPSLAARYGVPVGFSSHEQGIDFSAAACLLGAAMIERHLTLNRAMVGLDHGISLTPDEFAALAERARRLHKGRGVAVGLLPEELGTKAAYHVAVCSREAIAKGSVIAADMLACKQPLTDPAAYFTGMEEDAVIGRTALTDIPADTPIRRDAVGAPQ
jgi:sialic acid synthase SpsE